MTILKTHKPRERETQTDRQTETDRELVFYAQSITAVRERQRQTDRVTDRDNKTTTKTAVKLD